MAALVRKKAKMLDFQALDEKRIRFGELIAGLSKDDLKRFTHEMVDEILEILNGTVDADVIFRPVDPQAYDRFAAAAEEEKIPWTLGHVIVHTTASAEESAALAAAMARGIPIKDRSRFEVLWGEVRTVAQLRARAEESRRMRCAFLDVWPDEPHLDLYYAPWPGADEINAVGRFVYGLRHDFSHLSQLREIVRQARQARETQI
jgi:hypothetical protein